MNHLTIHFPEDMSRWRRQCARIKYAILLRKLFGEDVQMQVTEDTDALHYTWPQLGTLPPDLTLQRLDA